MDTSFSASLSNSEANTTTEVVPSPTCGVVRVGVVVVVVVVVVIVVVVKLG